MVLILDPQPVELCIGGGSWTPGGQVVARDSSNRVKHQAHSGWGQCGFGVSTGSLAGRQGEGEPRGEHCSLGAFYYPHQSF